MKNLTEQELGQIVKQFEMVFPDLYGYTDPDSVNSLIQIYLIFRNREESFNKDLAIARISYSWFKNPTYSGVFCYSWLV
jgi:hypothetical protein